MCNQWIVRFLCFTFKNAVFQAQPEMSISKILLQPVGFVSDICAKWKCNPQWFSAGQMESLSILNMVSSSCLKRNFLQLASVSFKRQTSYCCLNTSVILAWLEYMCILRIINVILIKIWKFWMYLHYKHCMDSI